MGERQLACVECGEATAGHGRGWEAHLAEGDEEGEEVVVFCPRCAVREFGDRCQRQPEPPFC